MSIISRDETPRGSNEVMLVDCGRAGAPRKVLEEEEYMGRMASIIRRDFFPHLAPSSDYDLETPKSIDSSRRYQSRIGTPATDRTCLSTATSVRSRHGACSLRLNDFLEKYTSEDNAYFEKLQRKELKRHRLKYPWLYKSDEKHDKQAQEQPPASERAAIANGKSSNKMIDRPHNPRSALFHLPESDDKFQSAHSTVNYESSKYMRQHIFKKPYPASKSGSATKSLNRFTDKIGIDGKLLDDSETPSMNGYSYVPEPETPKPAVDLSKVKIETNKFFIPCNSPRDDLAHRVYQDKVAKNIRTPRTGSSTAQTPKRSQPHPF